jgi:hypothetical protein
MATRTQNNMYCADCDAEVTAVRNTHRVRNTTAGFVGIGCAAVPGAKALGTLIKKHEAWSCPACEGVAVPMEHRDKVRRYKGKQRTQQVMGKTAAIAKIISIGMKD